MKKAVILVLLIVLSTSCYAVVKTDVDQRYWELESVPSVNDPAFLALDRISAIEGESVRYILVCDNCEIKWGSTSRECNGVCYDTLNAKDAPIEIHGRTDLYFKIPVNHQEKGILTISNSPDHMQLTGDPEYIPHYVPVINGTPQNYEREWVIEEVDGLETEKYIIGSYKPGDGVLKYPAELYDDSGHLVQRDSVRNPSFEKELDHWETKGKWSTKNTAVEGSYSAYVYNNEEAHTYIYQDFPVHHGTYTVSGYLKTEEVDGDGAYFEFLLRDEDGNVKKARSDKYKGDNDWTYFSEEIEVDEGYYMRVVLRLRDSTGEAWFDDIRVSDGSGNIMWFEDDDYEDYEVGEPEVSYDTIRVKGEVVAGREMEVEEVIEIKADGTQAVEIEPSLVYWDCDHCGSVVVDKDTTRKVTYKTHGPELTYQTNKAVAIDKYIQEVEVANPTGLNISNITVPVKVSGSCTDYRPEWLKEGYCYAQTDLKAHESKTIQINYTGNLIKAELGEIEQDMSKQSTLDQQYLKREVSFDIDESIDSYDFYYKAEMPGDCENNCTIHMTKVSPVLYLPFDGDTKDYSGNENHGVNHGGTFTEGKFGQAISFIENESAYVSISDSIGMVRTDEPFSFSFWINYQGIINESDSNLYENVFGTSSSYTSGFRIGFRHKYCSHALRYRIASSGTGSAICSPPLDDGDWHNIALVSTGTGYSKQISLYHNGNLSDQSENGIYSTNISLANLLIGDPAGLDAMIDTLYFFNTEIKQTDVESIFQGDFNSSNHESFLVYSSITKSPSESVKQKNDSQNVSFGMNLLKVDERYLDISSRTIETNGSKKVNKITALATFFGFKKGSLIEKRDLSKGLILHYDFEEGQGDIVVDRSCNNNHGVIHGGRWTVGKEGLGFEFDGIDDYIESNLTYQPGSFTQMAWIYSDNQTFGYSDIDSFDARWITKNDGEMGGLYVMGDGSAGYRLQYEDGTKVHLRPAKVRDGRWYHIAATFNDQSYELKVHLNGKLKGVKQLNKSKRLNDWNGILVGGVGNYWLSGRIDEFKIFNVSLNDLEIEKAYEGKNKFYKFGKKSIYTLIFLLVLILIIATYTQWRYGKD